MILVGRNISSGDDVVISICKLLLATEGRFTSVASVISKMLGITTGTVLCQKVYTFIFIVEKK